MACPRDDCFDRIFALLPKRLKDPLPELRPLLEQQQQQRRSRLATKGEGEGDGDGGDSSPTNNDDRRVSFGPDVVPSSSGRKPHTGGRRRGGKGKPQGLGAGSAAPEKEEAPAASTAATAPPSGAGAVAAAPPVPVVLLPLSLADDAVVARMSLMTDEELPCGVGRFLREFWGEASAFYR